ncbi:MAG: DinB family protein [Chitinophagaceae bacterium]|nr:DinB family protein [Chitinophagaceae bacterium]
MQVPSSLSTRLQYQHKCLVDLIDGLSEELIRRPVQAGKWSVFEHIVHLQTYQHIFISRVRQILEGKEPTLDKYTAEADPLFLDNCCKSFREIMHDFIATRKEMAADLLVLPESDYMKCGTHQAFGSMNLIQWINFFLLHEAHHLFTIFRLTATLKMETRLEA